MSKRTRWQPPHPAKTPEPPRAMSMKDPNRCQWGKCDRPVREAQVARLPFCSPHLDIIMRAAELHLNSTKPPIAPGQAEPKAPKRGHIYYVQVGDLIKVGFSTQLARRLNHYPPNAVVLAIHPGTNREERALHARFCADLAKGREWFNPSEALLSHIERVTADHGPVPYWCQDRYRDAAYYEPPRQAMRTKARR